MPCPTCDHTMHRIGCQMSDCLGSFICPRCGTAILEGDVIVPALVERCRRFQDEAVAVQTTRLADVWRRTGIAEAINLPAERPDERNYQI